ncbi:MAG: hypothetical protein IIA87_04655 [Nanoarchaeota archaeon]|nr:hypothetical protein [Nanoarchaeota archaeon]
MSELEQITLAVETEKTMRRGVNKIIHVWLEGFQRLIDGTELPKTTADKYLERKLAEYLPFTILQRRSFIMNRQQQIKSNQLFIKQLPVNNHYHLQFPLGLNGRSYEFVTEPCSLKSCPQLIPHKLPIIELRKSKMMNQFLEEHEGVIMYDNTIHVGHMDESTVLETYRALHDFIQTCSS